MNTSINGTSIDSEPRGRGEARERNLTTADLAASAADLAAPANKPLTSPNDRPGSATDTDAAKTRKEQSTLVPLFTDDAAKAFRSRWDDVQRGFVDDPRKAVQAGDELVAQVIKSLAESFSEQRSAVEGELNQADRSSTEDLRLALRRYRSFFERLLAI
jgi:hypothetical protein